MSKKKRQELLQQSTNELKEYLFLKTDQFFTDLETLKNFDFKRINNKKKITTLEKLCISLLMLGDSPKTITAKLNPEIQDENELEKKTRNLRTYMSRTVNYYITELINQQLELEDEEADVEELNQFLDNNRRDWPKMAFYFAKNGYRLSVEEIIAMEIQKKVGASGTEATVTFLTEQIQQIKH